MVRNTEWSFEKVLPYFVGLETDWDFTGAGHGSDGPMPVRSDPMADLHPASAAFFHEPEGQWAAISSWLPSARLRRWRLRLRRDGAFHRRPS
jgi:choline dehydrogenase-like flavoprotein